MFLLALAIMETFFIPRYTNVVIHKELIEQKYKFDSLADCKAKLTNLKSQHNLNSGLRCIPNGNIN